MMIEVLALSNTTMWLAVAAVVFFIAQTVFIKRVLKGLNSDVGDKHGPLPATNAAEINEESGFRTSVATPRPRKLQPSAARRGDEPLAPDSPVLTDVLPASKPVLLVSPATLPAKESELAEPVLASAGTPPPADNIRKDVLPVGESIVPPGALVLGAPAAGAGIPAVAKHADPVAASKIELPVTPASKIELPATPATPAKTLPPLAASEPAPSLPKPAVMPAEVPVSTRKFFTPAVAPAGALTASVNPPPAEKTTDAPASRPKEEIVMPALSSLIPAATGADKKPASVSGGSLPPPDAPIVPTFPKIDKPSAALEAAIPIIERVGDGLIAVGAPVKLTGDADAPSASADALSISAPAADDVMKKAPEPPAPEPATSAGLILIPPVESETEPAKATTTDVPAAEAVAKTEDKPVAAKTEDKPATEKPAEPVLSPAVADGLPATSPDAAAKPEVEAKPVKGPRVFLPGKFFGGSKKDKELVKAPEPAPLPEAAKVEPTIAKITEPASAPALVVPPVEEAAKMAEKPATGTVAPKDEKTPAADQKETAAPEPVAIKTPETPAAKAEPATKLEEAPRLEAMVPEKPASKPEITPESKAVEPVTPPTPTGKAPEEKAATPVPVPPMSTEKKSVPPGIPEHALVATSSEKPVESKLPTQAGPTTEPIAEPIATVLTPAAKPPEFVAASAPKAEPASETPVPIPSISKPQPVMPPTDTNTSLPNTGRASAQLTLAFEITSLQLTPFFKLGSVQLKALSNVVSLHLVAAQADNPLAAGISFQIEHVDLDGSSHLKSILLKPLGESRSITAPLPKLQVDNVAVTGGGEGAPISVTTSEQASTAVQLFGTFTIAAMDFTPAFEIGSLRLEPNSNTVLLRVAPSSRPTALDLPPSFEIAAVQLGDGAQITGVRVTPSAGKAA